MAYSICILASRKNGTRYIGTTKSLLQRAKTMTR